MRTKRRKEQHRALAIASACAALSISPGVPRSAWAQGAPASAADKATARITATEGIQLFRDEKYAEALDRFNRAQELYDAPVHLVYIARCQRQLGSLVEAAEVYRTLIRQELAPDAPDVFVNAVEDGKQELAELEPRIPQVVIRIAPADAPNLRLTLDGNQLPTAVVGIRRPLNPGRRTLRVTADGFEPQEQVIDVDEGAHPEVAISLRPVESEAAHEAHAELSDESAQEQEEVTHGGPSRSPLATVSMLLGARLGGVVPAGKLPGAAVHPQLEDDVRFKEVARVGGELELRIGAHFLKHWGVLGLLTLQQLNEQDGTFTGSGAIGSAVSFDPAAPSIGNLGFVVLGGTPRGEFGGYGELGLSVVRRLTMTTTASGAGGVALTCDGEMVASGTALRVGAGVNIPLRRRLLHLTPYVTAQFGGVTDVTYTPSDDCPDIMPDASINDPGGNYSTISFGIGGEFFIGGND